MKVEERRQKILNLLLSEKRAIRGSELSEAFGVSRQIIVGDINALKESGNEISATHTGYVIKSAAGNERVFKVFHTTEQTEDELLTIIALGGTVAEVFVWHKVYGKLAAKLGISTKDDIAQFIDGVRSGKSVELMNITGGYHYHTVRASSDEILDKIGMALAKKGYIAEGV